MSLEVGTHAHCLLVSVERPYRCLCLDTSSGGRPFGTQCCKGEERVVRVGTHTGVGERDQTNKGLYTL